MTAGAGFQRLLRSLAQLGIRGAAALFFLLGLPIASNAQPWHFTEVSQQAGVHYATGGGLSSAPRTMGGGVAAGDFDGDGWIDLYVIRIDAPNVLLRNMHDGTFTEVTGNGLNVTSGSGPTFADMDGDGKLDLVIGGIDGAMTRCFRNLGGGQFAEIPGGLATNPPDVYSTTLGDYDHDGDLDLVTTHWASNPRPRLWRNNGNGTFTEVPTAAAGFSPGPTQIFSFTPNFTDINNDGWPDLLLSADFGTSQVYINNRNGSFTRTTNSTVITDENGMGSAVGDYDHDGDLDWFVSSIYEANGSSGSWGSSGNRLYRNRGDGTFEDVTDLAGVRQGFWGWGSSFSDFNNDGNLDIFHVNGFPGSPFVADPARMFVSNGNGTFTQMAELLGIADTGEGRGIVVFDYDHDGDLDVFITNADQVTKLYRNDGGNALHWLDVKLQGTPPNTQAIGSKVYVTANGYTQLYEIRAASNFVSQSPAEAHFGLASATSAVVRVVWPNGTSSSPTTFPANQTATIDQGGGVAATVPTLGTLGLVVLALLLATVGLKFISRA